MHSKNVCLLQVHLQKVLHEPISDKEKWAWGSFDLLVIAYVHNLDDIITFAQESRLLAPFTIMD